MTGSASIPTRELDLRGTASLLSNNGGAAVPAFELPFMVQGRWDDPDVMLDPLARIQRSGAAAPLLDAVRNRGARDAVRSAIERLSGAPAHPSTTPTEPDAPALAGASAPTELAPAPGETKPLGHSPPADTSSPTR